MKLSVLQQHYTNRRGNSFRTSPGALDGAASVDGPLKSPAAVFWLLFHGLCCLISLVLGFRFSRLVFFLVLSPTTTNYSYTPVPILHTTATVTTTATSTSTFDTPPSSLAHPVLDSQAMLNRTGSRVSVGRHGIRIRPWPHPNPTEVMRAHRIIERVQREQRIQYGIKNPGRVIAVTPTYVRTFQTLHLTSLMHSLMLVPHPLVWVVVEAGGVTNETAAVLAKSKLQFIHLPFNERMPVDWSGRHQLEARMRLQALRVVRDQRLDGIVVFADDSNMHGMELFDEIQSVKWFGALSVGILAHSGNSESLPHKEVAKENSPLPIQGPACNSSGHLVGWHTFNTLPYAGKSATYVGDKATVLPRKLEWAGFVLNSRLLWEEAEGKPDWVRDFDTVGRNGGEIESPLNLLKDPSFVEPIGNCGRKVMLWWLRVEARSDSKFPSGWIIDPPLEITVPAKRTPWPDAPPELPFEKPIVIQDHVDKHPAKISRTSRSRHSRKKKRDSRLDAQATGAYQKLQEK